MSIQKRLIKATGVLPVLVFLIMGLCAPGLMAGPQENWNQLNEQATTLFEKEQFEAAVSKAAESINFAKSNFGDRSPQTIISLFNLVPFLAPGFHAYGEMPLLSNSWLIWGALICGGLTAFYAGDLGSYLCRRRILSESVQDEEEALWDCRGGVEA